MPTALGVGLTILFAGLGVKAGAQFAAGQKQKEAFGIAAEQAEKDAAYVRDITEEEVKKFSRQAKEFQSTQKSAIGASGLRLSGSALQLLEETEVEIARDIKSIKEAGEHRAESIETQGKLYKIQGEAALQAGILGAGTTLLTGLSEFAFNVPTFGNTTSTQFNPIGYNPFGV